MVIKYRVLTFDVMQSDLSPAASCFLLQFVSLCQKMGAPERGLDISKKELTELTKQCEHVNKAAREELEQKGFITYKQEATTKQGKIIKRKKGTIKLNARYLTTDTWTKKNEEDEEEKRETTTKRKTTTRARNTSRREREADLDNLII